MNPIVPFAVFFGILFITAFAHDGGDGGDGGVICGFGSNIICKPGEICVADACVPGHGGLHIGSRSKRQVPPYCDTNEDCQKYGEGRHYCKAHICRY
uniref:Uncharacterized protein n=1 Tax=Panagrolaimus davidi TaxID=227884 RepID=A0A914QGQ7_9BILA